MARERLLFEFDGDASKFKQAVKQSEKSVSGFSSNLAKVGGVIAGVFAVDKIIEFGSGVIETTATFQRFESVLTNTLGSTSEAQRALDRITDFASKTPFSVSELTDSFVRLANQGFKPTSDEMRKLGDLASSTGKEFVMLAEAIIDAQVGEFERLKEFGIRAEKQGDQVTFTFKNVKTQVDFTSDAIQNYILSLGDLEGVSGAMVGISNTLGGQISNLGDSFDKMKDTIGDALMPILTSVINKFKGLFEMITDLINPNQALIDDFKEAKDAVDNIEKATSDLTDTERKLLEIVNERKRQKLAELENQIALEVENLTQKISLQKQEVEKATEKFENIGKIVKELESKEKQLGDGVEYQSERLVEQGKVVEEATLKFNLLNKELSEFNRKVNEIRFPTEEVTPNKIALDNTETLGMSFMELRNQMIGIQRLDIGTIVPQTSVETSKQLSASISQLNTGFTDLNTLALTGIDLTTVFADVSEKIQEATRNQKQFALVTNIVTTGMNLMFDALSNPDAFDSFLKSIKQIVVQLLKQLAIMVAIAGVMALIGGTSFVKAFKAVSGLGGGEKSGGGIGGLLGFAEGGIVTKPVMGMIGEAGQSEAVIPLNRLPQMVGAIGGNQKGEFTLRGQDLILALERAGDFRSRITG